MTTITQVITPLPAAPDPATMTRDQFSAAAAAFVLAQRDDLVPDINTWSGQVNTVAGEVNTKATTATNKAVEAHDWANKNDGFVSGSENSAKSWSIGGSGDGAPAGGSAKDWAIAVGFVDGVNYSAKKHATDAAASASAAATSAASALTAPGTSATSTSSLTIGTGTQNLTIQTGKAFSVGQNVVIANTPSPYKRMAGVITAHDSGTGALTVNVDQIADSGTFSNWTVSLGALPAAGASLPPAVALSIL